MYLGFEKAGVTKLYTKAEYSLFSYSVTSEKQKQLKLVFLLGYIDYCIKMKRTVDLPLTNTI